MPFGITSTKIGVSHEIPNYLERCQAAHKNKLPSHEYRVICILYYVERRKKGTYHDNIPSTVNNNTAEASMSKSIPTP